MTRSPDEIERDVEQTRESLDRTVEALKGKMSPGQLIDEAMAAFGDGGGQLFANLGSQVRDNPLPVALIGAGVAWLMMGQKSHVATEPKSFAAGSTPDPSYAAGRAGAGSGGLLHKVGAAASHLTEAAKDSASKAGDALSSAQDTISSTASDIAAAAKAAGGRASDYNRQAQEGVRNLLDSEPLIVGAVGLTLGIAIGAALPSTPMEDKLLGKARDKVMDKSRDLAERGLDAAKEAVNTGLKAIGEDGGAPDASLSDNLHKAVDASLQAAKEQLAEPSH